MIKTKYPFHYSEELFVNLVYYDDTILCPKCLIGIHDIKSGTKIYNYCINCNIVFDICHCKKENRCENSFYVKMICEFTDGDQRLKKSTPVFDSIEQATENLHLMKPFFRCVNSDCPYQRN